MKIFALHDLKLNEFGQPFYFQANGQAVRFLQDLTRDAKTSIAQHPEDFRLYALGAYDPVSGTFENLPVPMLLADATSFVEEPSNVRKIATTH